MALRCQGRGGGGGGADPHLDEVRTAAYADDWAFYMSSWADLRILGPLMTAYNRASGGATNWSKCDGLRLGTLQGSVPDRALLDDPRVGDMRDIRWRDVDNDEVHAGCNVRIVHNAPMPELNGKAGHAVSSLGLGSWVVAVGERRFTIPASELEVMPTRYLGIHLGGPQSVKRMWESKVVGAISRRFEQLLVTGLPATLAGRCMVQKTLLFSKVVFYVTNQSMPGFETVLNQWKKELSEVLWASQAGNERVAAGDHRGRPPALVHHECVVQDHRDRGARARWTQWPSRPA